MPRRAMTGGAASMLIGPTVAAAVLPAASTARRVTDCSAALAVSVTSSGHTATFDSRSPQRKWTVTGPPYQPAAFGAVVGAPSMVGGVLSSLTVTLSLPWL